MTIRWHQWSLCRATVIVFHIIVPRTRLMSTKSINFLAGNYVMIFLTLDNFNCVWFVACPGDRKCKAMDICRCRKISTNIKSNVFLSSETLIFQALQLSFWLHKTVWESTGSLIWPYMYANWYIKFLLRKSSSPSTQPHPSQAYHS